MNQILSITMTLLAGGLAVKLFDRFWLSRKDKGDHDVEIMEMMRKNWNDALGRIVILETSSKEEQKKYEELKHEYYKLVAQYDRLKKDFEIYKNENEKLHT